MNAEKLLGRQYQTCIWAVAALAAFIVLLTCSARAQAPARNEVPACDPALVAGPNGTHPCPVENGEAQHGSADANPQPLEDTTPRFQTVRYFPVLNGPDPLVVSRPSHVGFIYGGSVTEAWDSAAAGLLSNLSSEVGTYEANMGLLSQGQKSAFLFQHSTTITRYGEPILPVQSLQRTLMVSSGVFNRGLGWVLEGRSTYGDESVRLVSQLPSNLLGQVPATQPDSAFLGVNTGRVWSPQLSGSLIWKPAPTHTVTFQTRDTYQKFFEDSSYNNIGSLKVDYQKTVSSRTSFGVYGMAVDERGHVLCHSTGGGLELALKPTQESMIELAAGPEFGTNGCGRLQKFNFHFALAGLVGHRIRAYLSANREFSSGYVTGSTWEDNIVGGTQMRLTKNLSWIVDGGFVRGTGAPLTNNYNGYVASSELRRTLFGDFVIAAGYRYFSNTVSSVGTGRNVAMVSLVWNRSNRRKGQDYRYDRSTTIMADARGSHYEGQ